MRRGVKLAVLALAGTLLQAGCCGNPGACGSERDEPIGVSDTEPAEPASQVQEPGPSGSDLTAGANSTPATLPQLAPLTEGLAAHALGAFDRARELLRPLAEQGDPLAQLHMGLMAVRGEGQAKDYAAAFDWFMKSAAGGNARAHWDVGLMHEQGEGRPINIEEALRWYVAGADLGSPKCYMQLANLYLSGEHVQEDEAVGMKWLVRAAEAGDPKGMTGLGLRKIVNEHRNDTHDYAEGLALLGAAAEQGEQHVIFMYPLLLWDLTEDETERRRAVRLMEEFLNSEQSEGFTDWALINIRANLMLAYFNGWGVPVDVGRAKEHAAWMDVLLEKNKDEDWTVLGNSGSDTTFHEALRTLVNARRSLETADPETICDAATLLMVAVPDMWIGESDLQLVESAAIEMQRRGISCPYLERALADEEIVCGPSSESPPETCLLTGMDRPLGPRSEYVEDFIRANL